MLVSCTAFTNYELIRRVGGFLHLVMEMPCLFRSIIYIHTGHRPRGSTSLLAKPWATSQRTWVAVRASPGAPGITQSVMRCRLPFTELGESNRRRLRPHQTMLVLNTRTVLNTHKQAYHGTPVRACAVELNTNKKTNPHTYNTHTQKWWLAALS